MVGTRYLVTLLNVLPLSGCQLSSHQRRVVCCRKLFRRQQLSRRSQVVLIVTIVEITALDHEKVLFHMT